MKPITNLKALYIFFAIITFSSCNEYGRKNGGAVFYICENCLSNNDLYIYVDDVKIPGSLKANYYNVVCGPDCSPDDLSPTYPNYKGEEGVHFFEVKDAAGKSYQKESFTIDKNECSQIQIAPDGCYANNQGGSGGNNNNFSLIGTWIRQSSSSHPDCEGMVVYFNGTNGVVSSSPSGCCFPSGSVKWKNFNSSSLAIDDESRNNSDCSSQGYTNSSVSFSDATHINIAGNNYVKQ